MTIKRTHIRRLTRCLRAKSHQFRKIYNSKHTLSHSNLEWNLHSKKVNLIKAQ
jgi:hypothetical protein